MNIKLLDRRIAYGAHCTWWDSIDKIGNRGGLPCCPHCQNVLFEMETIKPWNEGVDRVEADKPGYKDFITWLRGKCYPNYNKAVRAYVDATGKEVTL